MNDVYITGRQFMSSYKCYSSPSLAVYSDIDRPTGNTAEPHAEAEEQRFFLATVWSSEGLHSVSLIVTPTHTGFGNFLSPHDIEEPRAGS